MRSTERRRESAAGGALSRRPRADTDGRTFAEVWPELATAGSRLDVTRISRGKTETRPAECSAVIGHARPENMRKASDAGFRVHVAKPPDPVRIERLLS